MTIILAGLLHGGGGETSNGLLLVPSLCARPAARSSSVPYTALHGTFMDTRAPKMTRAAKEPRPLGQKWTYKQQTNVGGQRVTHI